MEDLRPKTFLLCAVLALAIVFNVPLRGRRAVQSSFAAADIAVRCASQSFTGFLEPDLRGRA